MSRDRVWPLTVTLTTRALRLTLAVLAALTGACSVPGPPPARALPAGQMVFMVMSAGGMLPPLLYALQSPSLVVYGDGRVLSVANRLARDPVPARYELRRADPGAVASFAAGAQAKAVITVGTDFGTPRYTDLGTTTVLLHGDQDPAEVRVYALNERFEANLTAGQRAARAALREVIGQASALAAGGEPVPYTPDSVVVYEVTAGRSSEPTVATWPGPDPQSFLTASAKRRSLACGVLSGDVARTVYQAALDNPGASWLVNGGTRILAVNPVPLPDSCP